MLYKSLARSHLEYANWLWNSYQKRDIKALEKVQMKATRLVTALHDNLDISGTVENSGSSYFEVQKIKR